MQNSSKTSLGARQPKDANIGPPKDPNRVIFGCQVGAKLSSKSTSKLLQFSTSSSKPLGLDFGSILGGVSGSNFGPTWLSKLKMPMCTKCCYLQYETMIFALPRGPKIDEKSMPKRLQDKIRFQEASKKSRKSAQHRPKLGPKIEPS